VTLLPVGIVVNEPGRFRSGNALVLIGAPVSLDEAHTLAGRDPVAAVRLLTDRLTEALRRQIVEAEDRETLRLLRVIERVWHEESGTAPEPRSATWLQRASRAYRWLRLSAPAEVEGFRREVEEYADELDRLGVRPETLGRRYAPSAVTRYTAREVVPLLGAPLAAVGMLLHALPTILASVSGCPADAPHGATYKMAGGVVIYPGVGFGAWLIRRLGGTGWLVVFLLALLPCGFFALAWQTRSQDVAREARGLLSFLARRGLHQRLIERRRALAEELERLAARVPEPVLAGERS
jgi:hypothetical protein